MEGPDDFAPLPPGSTVGILGGGQLGRMLCLAAARLGLRTHVFAERADGPAGQVATHTTVGAFNDEAALERFAGAVDAITYEWENVPVAAARLVGTGRRLAPNLTALRTAQDRLLEKTFLSGLDGVRVAPFRETSQSVHDFQRAVQYVGLPCVVKTRRGGYDGKGQAILRSRKDVDDAWEAFGAHDLIVEGFVEFSRECSVIVVRGADGSVATYPLTENVHRDHVLATSTAPASGDDGAAAAIATTVADALGYVGVLGVEFFDTPAGWLVNEIAPRVHNSGHWTQDAGCVDQFENHIRAVAGWPLGDTTPRHGVRMTNLLGDEAGKWRELAATRGRLHLYGKREARPGRKMGHVNERL